MEYPAEDDHAVVGEPQDQIPTMPKRLGVKWAKVETERFPRTRRYGCALARGRLVDHGGPNDIALRRGAVLGSTWRSIRFGHLGYRNRTKRNNS